MEQLCRGAFQAEGSIIGRQRWQLLVMQDVIRDEVGEVHACFARTEWVMLLLLDSSAGKKKIQIHCLLPPIETSSVALKHVGILRARLAVGDLGSQKQSYHQRQ